MQIVRFDEIRDYYEFMKLMHAAFGWTESLERIKKMRRNDPRYRDPFGFALQDGRRLLGFVGTVDLPLKTRAGPVEIAGGIHSVATDPAVSRSGVATRLLEHCHDYFRKQGYHFSLLCTSRALVAHRLYERLGYSDIEILDEYPRAYKSFPESKRKWREPKGQGSLDTGTIESIFAKATANRTGTAARPVNWPRYIVEERDLKPSSVVTVPNGYAFTSSWSATMFIEEWHALNRPACAEIYARLLKRKKSAWIVGQVDSPLVKQFLRDKGFSFAYRRYFVRMVKPLAGVSFDKVFGPRFLFGPLDSF